MQIKLVNWQTPLSGRVGMLVLAPLKKQLKSINGCNWRSCHLILSAVSNASAQTSNMAFRYRRTSWSPRWVLPPQPPQVHVSEREKFWKLLKPKFIPLFRSRTSKAVPTSSVTPWPQLRGAVEWHSYLIWLKSQKVVKNRKFILLAKPNQAANPAINREGRNIGAHRCKSSL